MLPAIATLPLWSVIGLFSICAVVIGFAGTRLATIALKLAERTGMGQIIAGAVFVGMSTSLPGSVLSVTTAWQGHTDLAIGNALGGIAAQTTFLAIADFLYRKGNLEHAAASATGLAQATLLVEDEDAVRTFGARALRGKGYDVLEANNGDNALEVLAKTDKTIDLVISDVVMPGIDGPTLIRMLREKRPDLRVIFISGYAEDTYRDELDEENGVHFLPKPFSLKELATKVKEVL